MTRGLTAQLADFAADIRFEMLPKATIDHAKLCLLDTVGCGLYGSTLPWVRLVADLVRTLDSGDSAALWGTGERSSAAYAAMVNGTAVHAYELDDLHPRSIVHPGAVVVSAALAAAAHAPAPVTGGDLIAAVVAGYEVAARVGASMGAAHLIQGWHPTGTHGALGAAAAAGSILGLTGDQMLHAIGTAGSHSSGLMAAQFSSMVKRLHAGHAAHSGVISALLARSGFLGIDDLLENDYGGYLSTFSPVSYPETILEGLGEVWQLDSVGFKPYSTNGSCHPTIDMLLELRATESLRPSDIERVSIRCSTATYKHVGWPYEPSSVTTAQMNLPYIVAVVLADGDAFVDQFTPERIADEDLVALSRLVDVVADEEIDRGGDAMRHATQLELVLKDGRILRDSRTHAKGSASSPLTVEDIESKFRKLAGKVLTAERLQLLEELVMNVERINDLTELEQALVAR